jgi:circadian clock protein KaiC
VNAELPVELDTVGQGLPKAPTGTGLDEVTGGGLPAGRATLVIGTAGTGKTLLGLGFLVAGAQRYGEPGVLVTFEESVEKIAANMRSLGVDLAEMQRDGALTAVPFLVDAAEIAVAGTFDFEPLLAGLGAVIEQTGAKRVVLDTVELLFSAFSDAATVRAEFGRLLRWLEDRNVTAIVTCERGGTSLTRFGIEEYVSDCVIMLDQRVTEGIATRHLRVVKYRGSAHGDNEYPFLISSHGFELLPIRSTLDYAASDERLSTGIPGLDEMLGGGLFKGSAVLVTGTSGMGKSSLAAWIAGAACERGEPVLLVQYEESARQMERNMRSIGLDLRRWREAGLLRIWASRPSAFGQEIHLAVLERLLVATAPSVVILDGINGLFHGDYNSDISRTMARKLDLIKGLGILSVVTASIHGGAGSLDGIQTMADSWLRLRSAEVGAERSRLLTVMKSRGSWHSNQARELVLTSHGIELADWHGGAFGWAEETLAADGAEADGRPEGRALQASRARRSGRG